MVWGGCMFGGWGDRRLSCLIMSYYPFILNKENRQYMQE